LEETLITREKDVKISEKALGKVSTDLNAEQAKTKATQHEYLNKMRVHTAVTPHVSKPHDYVNHMFMRL
jgi:hypothetical protein